MKKLVRLLIVLILLWVAALVLAACSNGNEAVQKSETSSSESSNALFRLGTLPAESAIPMLLAKENTKELEVIKS